MVDVARSLLTNVISGVTNGGSGEIKTNITDGKLGLPNVRGDRLCKELVGPEWVFDSPATGCPKRLLFKPICVNCRHNNFSGDQKTCCLTGESGDPKRTCNPSFTDFRFTGEACKTSWMTQCTGENIFSDPLCKMWREGNDNGKGKAIIERIVDYCKGKPEDENCLAQRTAMPEAYNQFMDIYCVGDKLDESICQGWVVTQNGKLDSRILNYCEGKPATGLCTCINSEVNALVKTFGSRAQVHCIDEDCVRSGYKTTGMLTDCPSVVDCTVINAVKENTGQINLSNQVINQNCSASTTFVGENETTTTVVDEGGRTTSSVPSFDSKPSFEAPPPAFSEQDLSPPLLPTTDFDIDSQFNDNDFSRLLDKPKPKFTDSPGFIILLIFIGLILLTIVVVIIFLVNRSKISRSKTY